MVTESDLQSLTFLMVRYILYQSIYKYSVKDAWLSDPSVYPLIASLFGAAAFIVGMSINAFVNYKDICINPAHKHQTVRDWGHEPTRSIALILAKHPTGPHAKDYEKIRYEGLGVDHEQWKKAKDQEARKQ